MKRVRLLLGSLLGSTLEYYEFGIFAMFTIYIGRTFFPECSSGNQIIFTFLIFGAGFVVRPLGSAIFGHIGDRMGRKKSLVFTVTGMSIVTILIGLVPSYESIGIMSPILLAALRLMQGLFLGGEGVGAAIYVLEHGMDKMSKMNRGVVGGMLISANMTGTLIASMVGLLINNTIGLDTHTWRWAFIIGGIAGLVISLIRLRLPETEEFQKVAPSAKQKAPLLQLGKHLRETVIVMAFGGFTASMSQINKGYLSTHFQDTMQFSANVAFLYVSYVAVVLAVLPPIFGYFSNKYTYTKFNKLIISLVGVLYLPAFVLITKPEPLYVISGLTIIAVLTAAILTPTYVFLSDLFPVEVRCSGVGVSFNIGVTLFGGFAPMVSKYLTKITGLNYSPAFYVLSLALIYVILLSFYTKHKKRVMRAQQESPIEQS